MALDPLYTKPHPIAAQHPLFSGASSVGIIGGESPRYPVGVPGGHEALKNLLHQQGLKYEETVGDYDGPEKFAIVHNPTREQLYHMGKVLGQDAVVYANGGHHELLYCNGPNNGHFRPGHIQHAFTPDEPMTQYWTALPGKGYFRLHFDSNRLYPAPLRSAEEINTSSGQTVPSDIVKGLKKALTEALERSRG